MIILKKKNNLGTYLQEMRITGEKKNLFWTNKRYVYLPGIPLMNL